MDQLHESCVAISLRTLWKPTDLATLARLHWTLYADEYGFDSSFETYVAGPLAEFAQRADPRERLWIAERQGEIVGCIAIVAATRETAQLRWFLVVPNSRGVGLGKQLLTEAIDFARQSGYREVVLWTVSALTKAARLYETVGFRKVEAKPGRMWGVEVVEEKYIYGFAPPREPIDEG